MKSVNIPVLLFFYIYDYFVYGDESTRDEITNRLKEKMHRLQLHQLYTNSKTAETEEAREAARKEYAELAGIPEDFRY